MIVLFNTEINQIECALIKGFSGKLFLTSGETKILNSNDIVEFVSSCHKNFLPILICFISETHNINVFKNSIKNVQYDNYNYNYILNLKSENQIIVSRNSLIFNKQTFFNRNYNENFDICRILYENELRN